MLMVQRVYLPTVQLLANQMASTERKLLQMTVQYSSRSSGDCMQRKRHLHVCHDRAATAADSLQPDEEHTST